MMSPLSAVQIAVRSLVGLLLVAFLVLPAPVAHGQGVAAKFSVKFKANGGTGTMKKQTFKTGVSQRLRKNAFKRSGGVFVGWAWSKNGTVAYKNRQIVKDLAVGGTVTLYARWAKSTYKIRFKANGGKGKMSVESFKYGKAKNLSKNRFKRNGYVFRGWSNRKNGAVMFSNGQKVKNLTKTGETIHLYAVWSSKTVSTSSSKSIGDLSGTWRGRSGSGQWSSILRISQKGNSISGSMTWEHTVKDDTRSVKGFRSGNSVTLYIGGGDVWHLTVSKNRMSGSGDKAGTNRKYNLSFSQH